MNITYIPKLSKLIAITVLSFSSSSIADQAFEIGLGTNHAGVLGGTINIDVNPNTEFFGGLGLTAGEGVGYVIGSRYWINDKLRLIGNYGYNCTVKTVSTTTTYKDYYGLNIGVGYSFGGIDSSGVALDLMLIDTSDCHNAVGSSESKSSMKLALGYRF